jgi:hypothetical protein
MTNSVPVEILESRAEAQRQQLHHSVVELRGVLRERLDVRAHARQYMLPASGLMAAIGLSLGYSLAGILFSRRR